MAYNYRKSLFDIITKKNIDEFTIYKIANILSKC